MKHGLWGKKRTAIRREKAEARQAEYNKLTIDQKIRSCQKGSKQHKRLVALKEQQNAGGTTN